VTFFEYLCIEAGMTREEARQAQERHERALAETVETLRPDVRAQREAWKRAFQSDT